MNKELTPKMEKMIMDLLEKKLIETEEETDYVGALNYIHRNYNPYQNRYDKYYCIENDRIAFTELEELVRKSMPKMISRKPTEHMMDIIECPRCGYLLTTAYKTDDLQRMKNVKYCNSCGQALKWLAIRRKNK